MSRALSKKPLIWDGVCYNSIGERMNKKTVGLVSLIVLLIAGIIGFWWIYNSYYLPGVRIENTYIEVYQDVDASEISTIVINTIDHKVVVKPTDDVKVKISYFQKIDNNNTFTISNHTVRLRMIEKAENLDNIFYQNTRPIDTITIYIPQGVLLNVTNDTVGGSLTVRDVKLKELRTVSVGGSVLVENSDIETIRLESNYGDLSVSGSTFVKLEIEAVTSPCRLSLTDSLSLYDLNLQSTYGVLLINNERVHEIIDELDTVVNKLVREMGNERTISISSVRSNITITSVEVYEEPEPPVENPGEQTEENNNENTEKKES